MSMSAWKPAGYPSMSPYRICKHGNFVVAYRHVAGNGDIADEVRSGLISVPAKPPLARALFLPKWNTASALMFYPRRSNFARSGTVTGHRQAA